MTMGRTPRITVNPVAPLIDDVVVKLALMSGSQRQYVTEQSRDPQTYIL
jgi:hypothetical protein